MENLILAVHYVVCSFLVVVILLQAGKGADIGAVFGGGGAGTVFGSRGAASFLSKLTTGMAIVFLLTSISLAYFSRIRGGSSVLENVPQDSSIIQPLEQPTEKPAEGETGKPEEAQPAK